MKKILPVVFIFFFLLVGKSFATPAEKIILSYDEENQMLFIEVKHITLKTHKHFIRRVVVSLNGEESNTFRYTFQISPKGLKEQLAIALEPEDKIEVEAKCNKGGSLTETFEMNQEK